MSHFYRGGGGLHIWTFSKDISPAEAARRDVGDLPDTAANRAAYCKDAIVSLSTSLPDAIVTKTAVRHVSWHPSVSCVQID